MSIVLRKESEEFRTSSLKWDFAFYYIIIFNVMNNQFIENILNTDCGNNAWGTSGGDGYKFSYFVTSLEKPKKQMTFRQTEKKLHPKKRNFLSSMQILRLTDQL